MAHPRIEEVSDSDMSDPSEGDIDDFTESDILRSIPDSSSTSTRQPASAPAFSPQAQAQHPMVNPSQLGGTASIQPGDIRGHQMLYPIYFDASRSRAEGRRVARSLAVSNPLAREIANACAALRLQPVFEAHKTHPGDWANPGRVRVRVQLHKSSPSEKAVRNKHHLYILVARHLRAHPTTEDSDALRRVRMPGLGGVPEDGTPWPRPAVPRGWKMGELLPAYSAAMTGGGVSENAFKDMMKEMQGGPGGGPGGGGGPADMMAMLGQGMGGGAGTAGGGGGGEGGGKKGKKGKGRA
ncbi:signal recognition particle, SRP19 subunit [Xylariaceae sp. FL0662B]|nr:signal recognition particle, SRP19 subunit [Xylariaceae sp. FL0662B]